MKKLLCVTLALFATAALANDQTVQGQSLNVKERLQVMELINIAAEKEQAKDVEPLDAELMAILKEAQALETSLEKPLETEETD